MYDKLLNTMVGDTHQFQTEEVPDAFKNQISGKSIELTLKVNRVYTCEDAKIDDDLAITANYKSLEEWKQHLKNAAGRMAEAQYDLYKKQLVLKSVMDVSEIGDFPDPWLDNKVESLGSHPDDSDPDIIKKQINEVARQSAVLRHFGEMKEIEWDDKDKSREIRDEASYAQKVLQHLVGKAKFTYAGQEAEETVDGNQEVSEQQSSP
jgi:hypothetical protein